MVRIFENQSRLLILDRRDFPGGFFFLPFLASGLFMVAMYIWPQLITSERRYLCIREAADRVDCRQNWEFGVYSAPVSRELQNVTAVRVERDEYEVPYGDCATYFKSILVLLSGPYAHTWIDSSAVDGCEHGDPASMQRFAGDIQRVLDGELDAATFRYFPEVNQPRDSRMGLLVFGVIFALIGGYGISKMDWPAWVVVSRGDEYVRRTESLPKPLRKTFPLAAVQRVVLQGRLERDFSSKRARRVHRSLIRKAPGQWVWGRAPMTAGYRVAIEMKDGPRLLVMHSKSKAHATAVAERVGRYLDRELFMESTLSDAPDSPESQDSPPRKA